jgi:hypothetical protein
MQSYRFPVRFLALVMWAAFLLAAFPAGAAHAQPHPERRQLILTITAPLYADCTSVPDTEAARNQLWWWHTAVESGDKLNCRTFHSWELH